MNPKRPVQLLCAVATLSAGVLLSENLKTSSSADCTFQSQRDEYLAREGRVRSAVFDRTRLAARQSKAAPRAAVEAGSIPLNSFIDSEIFGRLAQMHVPSAPLAGDQEFVRRIYFDLTGRLPSPDQVRSFVSDSAADKRAVLIRRLLYSPEFMDKWTMWFGDLLQVSTVFSLQGLTADMRNGFQGWIKESIAADKSIRDMVFELLTAKTPYAADYSVNTAQPEYGPANWVIMSQTPGGPIQDTWDNRFSRAASQFLGTAHYDCLLCHNGRGHLDAVSLWGKGVTRAEAEQMAAFFSRTQVERQGNQTLPNYNTWRVHDRLQGTYTLGTTYGNRPVRPVIGAQRDLTPVYRGTGAKPTDWDYRGAFAAELTKDPMFARNFANRIWKQIFGLGLVDPVDTLDPARLDPANPPPEPWTLQATHPVLLELLAQWLRDNNYNLHQYVELLVSSSAYQLSSSYDGDWNLGYVPLFARHYPRRLDGEEVHDAISIATGAFNKYTVAGWGDPVQFAMQLPEPLEPRSSGAAAAFMNYFLRGNRDTAQRSQAGSILQQMALMNDNFVYSRTRVGTSPALAAIARMADNQAAVRELWLTFLSRQPEPDELAKAVAHLGKASTAAQRNAAVEDLAWAAINKVEFVFSY